MIIFLYWAYFGFLAYLRCFTGNLLRLNHYFFFSQCAYSFKQTRLPLLEDGRDRWHGSPHALTRNNFAQSQFFTFCRESHHLWITLGLKVSVPCYTVQMWHFAARRVLPQLLAYLCFSCFAHVLGCANSEAHMFSFLGLGDIQRGYMGPPSL